MENIYSNNKKKKTLDFTFLLKSYQKMKRKEKKRYNRNNSRTIKSTFLRNYNYVIPKKKNSFRSRALTSRFPIP